MTQARAFGDGQSVERVAVAVVADGLRLD